MEIASLAYQAQRIQETERELHAILLKQNIPKWRAFVDEREASLLFSTQKLTRYTARTAYTQCFSEIHVLSVGKNF